jgi:DNA polymerase III sliding clamp (beta) subunit (PCNA family)
MSAITFQFPANKLRGAAIFTAQNDIRYYLNGVCFTRAPNGAGMLAVATDGHRMTVIFHAQDVAHVPENFGCIVPTEQLLQAAKAPIKAAGTFLDVVISAAPGAEGKLAITLRSAVTVECDAIDGKFPDYQRVMPSLKGRKPSNTCLNADYVADYAKLSRALGKRIHQVAFSTSGEDNSVVISIGDPDVFCVCMPMRGDLPESSPFWMDPPAKVATRKAA